MRRPTRELGVYAGSLDLLLFYLPLAASGLLITLQQPVVGAGIARSREPAVQLAAYGVVLSLIVLLESPIQMLLQTSTALVADARSFQLVSRLTLLAGLALSGLGLALFVTPLAVLVTDDLLGLPSQVGAATRAALWVMVPWPLAVAWRRFYQGVLVGAGRVGAVSWATLCRLVAIGLTVSVGLALAAPLPGALLGSISLLAGAVGEAAMVTWWARPVVRQMLADPLKREDTRLTFAGLLSFYAPLAITSVMTVLVWPIISGALARGRSPVLSLAAWPIALGVWWLFGTPLQMLQQAVIAALTSGVARSAVSSLTLAVGVSASFLLAATSLSPLLDLFVTWMIGAPPELTKAVVATMHAMIPLPLLATLQARLQGELIARAMTRQVRTATAVNFAALTLVLLAGTRWGMREGTQLAAASLVVAVAVEVAVLHRYVRAAPLSPEVRVGPAVVTE
ncbi:MAG: hypothetical protein HYY04_07660 [Chloroflexi bacterium]|nr:hypothetical protein [Chloroflexota bacterium]